MAGKAWIEGTGHRLPSETVILNRKPGHRSQKASSRLSRSVSAVPLVLLTSVSNYGDMFTCLGIRHANAGLAIRGTARPSGEYFN